MAKAKNEAQNGTEAPEMQIEYWDIDKLVPYVRNPRRNDDAVPKMAGLIKEFGFKVPVVIRSDGEVIDGHLRLKAARQLGMEQVPVVLADEWTPAQVKAFRLAVNRSAEWAEWDDELLKLELDDLKLEDFDLDLIGFEDVALDDGGTEGLTAPDEVPEMQEKPVTRQGDIWLLGKHRLMCGDSTDAGSVALLMNGAKADMVFTDPPYGMKLDTDYSSMVNRLDFAKDKNVKSGKRYDAVIRDNQDFKPELIKTVFDNFAYCKEVFLWGADYYAEILPDKNDGAWIVWDKRLDDGADKMYGSCFELCWSKNKHKRDIARIKWAGIFGTEQEFDHKRHHPTQKPIDLVLWFFERYAGKNCSVVDLYGGSGSTLIACEQTGRQCRMMELSEHYVDVIVRRWQDFTGQEATLEGDGRTFAQIAEERG